MDEHEGFARSCGGKRAGKMREARADHIPQILGSAEHVRGRKGRLPFRCEKEEQKEGVECWNRLGVSLLIVSL